MKERELKIAPEGMQPPRFGTIAVQLGYITAEQLKEALMEQVDDDLADRPHRVLGHILLDKGWITVRQLEHALDKTIEAGDRLRPPRRMRP